MNFYYEQCIVIGTGQLAFNCAKYLYDVHRLDGVYEYGNYEQSGLERLCRTNNLPYIKILDKQKCAKIMEGIAQSRKKTLIVSASNTYIFPRFIAEDQNIRVINYHPALLTKHLGRNVEAWAIYDQDEVAGVTWHEVTALVDRGKVLHESVIELDSGVTALRLMLKQYQTGFASFREFIGGVLRGTDFGEDKITNYGKMHYSYEKPNDGRLDLSWNGDKISSFLRCMDYGKLNVLGRPFFIEGASKYIWDSYRIEKIRGGGICESKDRVIAKDDLRIILQNIHLLV